jgi:mycobactin lysine-N-oxygenase
VPLLSRPAVDMLEAGLDGQLTGERLEDSIGHDLAVEGISPKLVLPNLSGVNEGPGFPNLSCLGLMSDRVLGAEMGVTDPPMGRSGEYQSV